MPKLTKKVSQILVLFQELSNLDHLVMQSNHKNAFRTKHDGASSNLIVKQWGVTYIWSCRGEAFTQILPKTSPNIGTMQIASQFGTYDNTK